MTQDGLPYGRSLNDFLNQTGPSRLRPSEDLLLAAVTKGELCDLTDRTGALRSYDRLCASLSDSRMHALAVEVFSSPNGLFASRADNDPHETELWEREARVRALPSLSQFFLKELHRCAASHADIVQRLQAGTGPDREILRPVLDEILGKYRTESSRWRQVDIANSKVRIRAAFVRFLALGGDGAAPTHERGVCLKGACIDGQLDLTSCDEVLPLNFTDCVFSDPIGLAGARLSKLNLTGCHIPAVHAVRCQIGNDVRLDEGFVSTGPVWLTGADIGGSLDCAGATLCAGFDCVNADISGDVFLSPDFECRQEVALGGAIIGGSLFCTSGTFSNQTADGLGKALSCDAAKISGSVSMRNIRASGRVFLMRVEVGYSLEFHGAVICNQKSTGLRPALQCQGAKIEGNVIFRDDSRVEGGAGFAGAIIKGTLDCSGATFSNAVSRASPAASRDRIAVADVSLDISNASIGEAFRLRQHDDNATSVSGKIDGSLDLTGAHARMLIDDPASWPISVAAKEDGEQLACEIRLDGFTFDRLSDGAPSSAKQRLNWLSRQPAPHLRENFRSQPFEQLVKVLREMGHDADARQIAIAKVRNRRKAEFMEIWLSVAQWPLGWPASVLKLRDLFAAILITIKSAVEWLIVDFVLGNGYAKLRPLVLFLALLFGCAMFYQEAWSEEAFVPTNPLIYKDVAIREACAGQPVPDLKKEVKWARCVDVPRELNPFRPLIYSVEQMIPFLQLGQKRDWQPTLKVLNLKWPALGYFRLPASTTLVVTWCQSIGSTMLYLFVAAILSGLIKRD